MNGRSAFLQLLVDEGVTHLFGNPGTTELAIMAAVPDFPQLEYVLALQEAAVVGMADGYARASGRLAACNLHCMPGLGHAMGAVYSAKFAGSPLIVTAGQYEIGYGLQEPMLYEPLVPVAQPLVKWAVEVPRVDDLPRIVHRAAKIATTPPAGPVFLSLPGSVLDEAAQVDLGRPTRVIASVRPSDTELAALAARLLAARAPVIIAGRELAQRDAFAPACELAEVLGAAVYREPVPYNARYPSEHRANMGDLTRNQSRVRDTLSQYDLLLCLGADLLRMSPYSPVDPLPAGMPVVHVSERDWELGKNYPTEIAIRADVAETLKALLPVLCRLRAPDYAGQARRRLDALAARNWSAQRASARAGVTPGTPIDARYLALCLADALPEEAIVVEEAVSSAAALSTFLSVRRADGYYGLASGGLGFGMAGAVGVSLARPGRPVVAAIGDGSAMYTVQALWTAARHALPVTYVIFNNRSYRILKERLVANRGSERFVGMDLKHPEIDFVGVARGLGLGAQRVSEARELSDVLRAAIASGEPNLVDVRIDDGFGNA